MALTPSVSCRFSYSREAPIRYTLRYLLAGALVTGLAIPAAALGRVARFQESLQGTYSAHGTMTDSTCWRADENDNVTKFTQTGTASESDAFHSTAPVILTVSQVPRQRTVDAGSFGRLRTAFKLSRTSTASPAYCTPDEQYHAVPADCGTKHGKYSIWVYGRVDRPGFSFQFSRDDSPYHPDDPFTSCPLFGPVWPGQLLTAGTAPVVAARLFNPAIKRIVVHGHYGGATGDHESGLSERGTYTLAWTLTLVRRG